MTNQLTFQTIAFNVIERNNQIWLSSTELAKALGYANVRSISKIYNANADEFSEQMTMITETVIDGINNTKRKIQQRIFSLRGCHLIAMFSQTEIAKAFRKWVLDILDKEVLQNPQPALPLVEEKKFSFEQTQAQWLRFASSWYALYNCVELLGKLDKPLHALGSSYAPQVAGCATEYQTVLGVMQRILVPMFEQFDVDPLEDRHYYKALKTLREYQPKGLGGLVRI